MVFVIEPFEIVRGGQRPYVVPNGAYLMRVLQKDGCEKMWDVGPRSFLNPVCPYKPIGVRSRLKLSTTVVMAIYGVAIIVV